jgi:hypothetical protein
MRIEEGNGRSSPPFVPNVEVKYGDVYEAIETMPSTIWHHVVCDSKQEAKSLSQCIKQWMAKKQMTGIHVRLVTKERAVYWLRER